MNTHNRIGYALVLLGSAGLGIGFVFDPMDTWIWLIVSFLIFSGIANGMLAWAAILRVAQARWTPVVNRLCHSAIAFVPVLAAALTALLAGCRTYAPWARERMPGREAWFNVTSFTLREAMSLVAFWGLSFLMVRWSLVADAKSARGEKLIRIDHLHINAVCVGVIAAYVIASSVVAYDFVMGFSPEWVSTAFAPYYMCTALFAAMSIVVMLAFAHRDGIRSPYLKPARIQDLGNLMLGFAFFCMGLFFAQYLTIWYGNLHHETHFLLIRYVYGQWPWLGWASFVIAYGLPFVLLQSRHIKLHVRLLSYTATTALTGYGLERYVLVVPSLRIHDLVPFPAGALLLPGFAAALALTTSAFIQNYPAISSADAALKDIYTAESSLL